MRLHQILLTAHILAAILTIGWLATTSMVMPGIIRRGPESAGVVRAVGMVAKKLGPMSGIVFLLGIWLVLDSDDVYSFGDTWLSASMLIYIVTAVIGAVFIGGAERRAAEKLSTGQRADEEARTISILGGISSLLLVLIVYLMVAKDTAF